MKALYYIFLITFFLNITAMISDSKEKSKQEATRNINGLVEKLSKLRKNTLEAGFETIKNASEIQEKQLDFFEDHDKEIIHKDNKKDDNMLIKQLQFFELPEELSAHALISNPIYFIYCLAFAENLEDIKKRDAAQEYLHSLFAYEGIPLQRAKLINNKRAIERFLKADERLFLEKHVDRGARISDSEIKEIAESDKTINYLYKNDTNPYGKTLRSGIDAVIRRNVAHEICHALMVNNLLDLHSLKLTLNEKISGAHTEYKDGSNIYDLNKNMYYMLLIQLSGCIGEMIIGRPMISKNDARFDTCFQIYSNNLSGDILAAIKCAFAIDYRITPVHRNLDYFKRAQEIKNILDQACHDAYEILYQIIHQEGMSNPIKKLSEWLISQKKTSQDQDLSGKTKPTQATNKFNKAVLELTSEDIKKIFPKKKMIAPLSNSTLWNKAQAGSLNFKNTK